MGRPKSDSGEMVGQCTATNRQGKQCGKYAIPGGAVCVLHGGKAPQVREEAKARLRAMVNPAMGVLEYAMKNKDADLRSAISAAKEVLDRADFGEEGGPLEAKQNITVTFVKHDGS